MSTPASESSLPSPRYQFNVEVCKGNITAGSIPTSIQVMTTIDGHIVNTTEGKPWPATWNEHITHYFHTLQPTTPVLISFSLYRRRFTTKSWKLVGSVHFSLHDFIKFINKGSFQQEFQVILNRKSLMTFSGTLQLKFEVIDRWDTSSTPTIAPDTTIDSTKSCSGSTDSDDSHKVDVAPDIIAQSTKTPENVGNTIEDDTPEDGHSTTKRPWTRRMSLLANSIFGTSKAHAHDDHSNHGHHHHHHGHNHDHQHHDDVHLVDGTYSSDSDPEDHESQKRPTSANLTEAKPVVASATAAAPGINNKNVYICPLSPSALSSFTVAATAVAASTTTTTTTTTTMTNKDQQSPDDNSPPIVEKSSVTKTTYTTISWFLRDWVLVPLEEIYRWETLFAVVVFLCVFLYWLNWRQVRHLDDSIDRIEARLYDMLQRPLK
eukprot:gene7227-5202_t